MSTDAVTVVGAGGIGSAVGAAFRTAGIPVVLVESNPAKIEHGRREGWTVVPFAEWQPGAADLIFLCVKCYDNAAVLAKLPPAALLVPIQNGFDPQLDAFGHAAEGIASFVAACPPDRVETVITRPGELHVGSRGSHPAPPRLLDLMSRLNPKLFRLKLVPNVLPIKYTKLMYNAAISPLAAASGIDNGQLLSDPSARRLFFSLIQENYAILSAAGVELGTVGPFHPRTVARILRQKWLARLMAKFFEPSLRGTYCSMAGEIEKGRTELDNYNGHLLELAAGRVDVPLNRAVYDLVKRMEREKEKPARDVIQRLGKQV
ncbi:ketopantoate reductase family protein [Limnoglobus roseus]|uniref:2-dehydropantoate 2-reductase n=1 Tax=Limnoglobus roseus TaxID=2598579 RepID=A0A5C1ARQ6_9BACT|nr:ketopantoate reductase C-terminal domain-containing protein [Limnoglobus roseus]QEL20392.1 hypothetical protein PX52LOC_07485 [Limnoglobus roseus]